jgi:hypothetical protein
MTRWIAGLVLLASAGLAHASAGGSEAERLLDMYLANGNAGVHERYVEFVASDRRYASLAADTRAWHAGLPGGEGAVRAFERRYAGAATERSRLVRRSLDLLFPLDSVASSGSVVTLQHPMFDQAVADLGTSDPEEFFRRIGGGIYLLEPFDPSRDVLLAVHGMAGTPRNFATLHPALASRFQVWVAYYPTGAPLTRSASLVANALTQLLARHDVKRMAVLTHSLGGIVWRSLPLAGARIPPFVKTTYHMCTPHRGVHFRPISAVRFLSRLLWRHIPPNTNDLLEGSKFMKSLAALPVTPGVHRSIGGYGHHVWFRTLVGAFIPGQDDGMVPLASSVLPYGSGHVSLEEDHVTMLDAPEVRRQLAAWFTIDL